MNTNKLTYLNYKPTIQEQKDMARAILYTEGKMRYKRLKSGKYKVSCCRCGETYTVKDEDFKLIHASKICSHCNNEILKFTTIESEVLWKWIIKGNNGFFMKIRDELGHKPKILICEQVLADDGNAIYRRNVVRNMYSLNRCDTQGWKKVRYTDYTSYFYKYEYMDRNYKPITKKELYESYFMDKLDLKSNQKKLIMDNLYNREQIKFIKMFNLKKAQDLYKYRAYISRNERDIWAINDENIIELNEYYLHYLWKNKIKLLDFVDYIEQCEILKVKLDKPKDFNERHDAYSHRIAWLEDQEKNKRIQRRYKQYEKYSYKSKEIEIKPFKSVKEIIDCGERLHNCIARYASNYAAGNTKIFYLTEKGKLKAAIEVKKGRLIQARIKNNEWCTRKQMIHINRWLKKNGWKNA